MRKARGRGRDSSLKASDVFEEDVQGETVERCESRQEGGEEMEERLGAGIIHALLAGVEDGERLARRGEQPEVGAEVGEGVGGQRRDVGLPGTDE